MARKQFYFQGNRYGTRNDQDHRTDKQLTCALPVSLKRVIQMPRPAPT